MTSMCSSLFSQVIDSKQFNYVGNWYNWQGGKFITNLNIPKVQASTGRDTGAIYYRLADSSLYIWSGSQWRQVTGSGGGSSYTFTNGLTESAGTVKLGGALTEPTNLYGSTFKASYSISGTDSVVFGTTFSPSFRVDKYSTGRANNLIVGNNMYFEVNDGTSQSAGLEFLNNGSGSLTTRFQDSRTVKTGLQYTDIDTTGWTNFTLVPKNYINQRLSSLPSGSTSLNNVGTGYDVAVQGTANVKRFKEGYRIKLDSITTANSLTLSLDSTTQTLTDGATITFNANNGVSAQVTLGGNRTLAFSNFSAGTYLTLLVIQDGTGSRTLTLPAGTKVINGGAGAVTLTTAASSQDVLTFFKIGTTIYCNYGKNYN